MMIGYCNFLHSLMIIYYFSKIFYIIYVNENEIKIKIFIWDSHLFKIFSYFHLLQI